MLTLHYQKVITMNTWLDRLNQEVDEAVTDKQKIEFAKKHPFLMTWGVGYYLASKLFLLFWWLVIGAGFILGLKALWLGIKWLWGLV